MPKKKFYKKSKKTNTVKVIGFPKERDYILENLALLISAGIGTVEAVNIVASSLKSKRLKKVLANVAQDLDGGSPLWKALDKVNLLDKSYINLIKVGEQSGRLVDNLKMIIVQQQKARTFKEKVHMAMAYPTIVLILIVLIGLGMAWFVLPKLMAPFIAIGSDVPPITLVLVKVGNFLKDYGYIFVPGLLIFLTAIIYIVFLNRKTRFIGQAILFRVPGAKRIIKESEVARFGYVLAGLLESGIPLVDSLEAICDTSTYRQYTKFYMHLKNSVEQGNSIEKSFGSYKKSPSLIPTPIQQMIFSGERSGNLSGVLGRVADIYEEKVDVSTQNLSTYIEPALLLVVGAGVLVIALGVILPIYSLVGSIQ